MEVGARVVSRKDGALGTVRYVGAVEGEAAGGTWAGVEWDDPARGRHDGTLRSRAYFACAPGRSASFARPDALGPARSLLDALRLRYGPAGGAGDAGDEMCVYTAQQRRVPVTLVGAERQRVSIGSLRVADVSALGVERADDEGLGAECASLEELAQCTVPNATTRCYVRYGYPVSFGGVWRGIYEVEMQAGSTGQWYTSVPLGGSGDVLEATARCTCGGLQTWLSGNYQVATTYP
eukprot:m51a1_g8345 hypothetical protein (236) ;mRNA; f:34766-35706